MFASDADPKGMPVLGASEKALIYFPFWVGE